jgi:exopolysaccharide biosynthesis polyprenyl glycosylphosphotransferase
LVKQQHQLFVALLCFVDGLVVSGACFAAWGVRKLCAEPWVPRSWETYFKEPLILFAVPIVLYTMWCFGLYRARRDRSMWGEQAQLIKACLVSTLVLVVALWAAENSVVTGGYNYRPATVFGREVDPGRLQLGALAAFLPVLLCTHRWVFRRVLRVIRKRGWNLRHAAVIGVGRLGHITCRTLSRNQWTGINVAYFVSHHEQTKRDTCLGRPVHGGLADLDRILEEHRVDAVYLAIPNSCASAVPSVLQKLERFAVDVRVIPDVNPRYLQQSMVVSELDGMPILSYRESPLYGLGGATKRVLDFLGACAALVIFGPLMLVVALLVRMSSPGPVIFKQRRVSLGGEEFNIYKFRTMRHVEDEQPMRVAPAGSATERVCGCGYALGGLAVREGEFACPECRVVHTATARVDGWTERNDPRITPIGRWLRRTSVDELPQLLNVLRGDMSLVGPRPERPELIERFRDDWRGYMLRQHVKAGMTGWAQVNGLRGDTSLKKRLQHDLFYIRHWSLSFDMKILWLTVFRGFVHKNAH